MVWSRSCLGIAAAILLASSAVFAADSVPAAPIASLQLKDGRILHNVKIMSDEGENVVVHADEGLLKIPKSVLPQTVSAPPSAATVPAGPPQLVMERFDPNQPPETLPAEPGTKPKASPAANPGAAPRPAAAAVYKGCSIISFQVKSFQSVRGCAEVIIRNDTDEAVLIRPGEVSCTTSDGARHLARNIITDAFPPAVKKRELVPARGQVDDIFAFSNEPLGIASVQWAR